MNMKGYYCTQCWETHTEWDVVKMGKEVMVIRCKVCKNTEEIAIPECIYCGSKDYEIVDENIFRCTVCGRAWNIFTGERKPGFDMDPDDTILNRILTEVQQRRAQQDEKWGYPQVHTLQDWFCILGEEVGEAAKAIIEHQDVRSEILDVAAVAVAIIQHIDADETEDTYQPPGAIILKCPNCGRTLVIDNPSEDKGIQCIKCNEKYVLTNSAGEWDLLTYEDEDWPGEEADGSD